MVKPGAFRMNRINANGQFFPKWLDKLERKHSNGRGVAIGVTLILSLALLTGSYNFSRGSTSLGFLCNFSNFVAQYRLPSSFTQERIDADQITKLKDVPIFTK